MINRLRNRSEMYTCISKLPLFEKRVVKVKDDIFIDKYNYTIQTDSAICEVGKTEALAYPRAGYKLVQLRTLFKDILDSIPGDVTGSVGYYHGSAFIKIFPEGLKNDDVRYGILAINSVDLSTGINVKFVVKKGDSVYFTMPAKVAGLRKRHVGNVDDIIQDYIELIGKVKKVWNTIVEKFPQYIISFSPDADDDFQLEFGTVVEQLDLGKRLTKKIKENINQNKNYTLWDLFIMVINETAQSETKSDYHWEKRIEKISNAIFQYAIVLNI